MSRILYICTARDCRAKAVKGFSYGTVHTLNGWIAGIFGEEARQRLYERSAWEKVEFLLKYAGILVEPVAGKNQNKGAER